MLSTAHVPNCQNSESKSEVGPTKKLAQSEVVKSQQATLRGHFQEDSAIKEGSCKNQPNKKP